MKYFFIFLMLLSQVMCLNGQNVNLNKRSEATDRIAIKELIDNYGYYADRREADKQAGLFSEKGLLENYVTEPSDTSKPVSFFRGRKALEDAFQTLKQFQQTFHFNGQATIKIYGDSATGIVYCLAHHILMENGKRMLLVMGIHYYDTYTFQNNEWLFADRKLIIDWRDKRASTPG
jgi:SnoaL-like protein